MKAVQMEGAAMFTQGFDLSGNLGTLGDRADEAEGFAGDWFSPLVSPSPSTRLRGWSDTIAWLRPSPSRRALPPESPTLRRTGKWMGSWIRLGRPWKNRDPRWPRSGRRSGTSTHCGCT